MRCDCPCRSRLRTSVRSACTSRCTRHAVADELQAGADEAGLDDLVEPALRAVHDATLVERVLCFRRVAVLFESRHVLRLGHRGRVEQTSLARSLDACVSARGNHVAAFDERLLRAFAHLLRVLLVDLNLLHVERRLLIGHRVHEQVLLPCGGLLLLLILSNVANHLRAGCGSGDQRRSRCDGDRITHGAAS
jgi:hypothetical protein